MQTVSSRKFFVSAAAVCALGSGLFIASAQQARAQTTITGFNFNNTTTQATLLTSTTGQATMLTTNFANADVSSANTGTTVNLASGDVAGNDLTLLNQAENGNYLQLAVDTTGYNTLMVNFASMRSGTGFGQTATPDQVFYSSSGTAGTFTQLQTYTLTTSYAKKTIDFTSATALNNNPNAVIRIVFNGATSAAGNNRIDNFYLTGNVVTADTPEPGTFALVLTALPVLGSIGLRRCAMGRKARVAAHA